MSAKSDKYFVNYQMEIPFYDLDPLNIVWHGNYIKYFENARCMLFNKLNYSYPEMKKSGYMWPVIEVKVRFANPAIFGQKINCYAYISEYQHRLKVNYEITCVKTKKRLTKGHTTQVAIDLTSNEMLLESPAILFEKLGLNNVSD